MTSDGAAPELPDPTTEEPPGVVDGPTPDPPATDGPATDGPATIALDEPDQPDEDGDQPTAAPAPAPAASLPELPLRVLLEAVLMVAEQPVPATELASGLETTTVRVEATLAELASEYLRDGRGFSLRNIGGGWRFYTSEDAAGWVERFVLAGQTARLSQAALETLAVVAYQQPVSRGRIAAVRGVSADGVIRTLSTRGLVEEAGNDAETGAILYRTTPYFLERLGLRDLAELPPLAPLLPELSDVEEVAANP